MSLACKLRGHAKLRETGWVLPQPLSWTGWPAEVSLETFLLEPCLAHLAPVFRPWPASPWVCMEKERVGSCSSACLMCSMPAVPSMLKFRAITLLPGSLLSTAE